MFGSMWLFGWWLSRKERRSESADGRPWEALSADERERRLRQVAAKRAQAQATRADGRPGPSAP